MATISNSLQKTQYTLCFVVKEGQILLGRKRRGFGEGKWNGFGGKVQLGETIEDAVRRELKEECDLDAHVLQKCAVLDFEYLPLEKVHEVHVFFATVWTGEERATDEMEPKWHDIRSMPYDDMWPDDRDWVPKVLSGQCLRGHFRFSTMEAYEVIRLEQIV